MSEARWAQVKALFQAAVERPASERAAFLAAATGGDELLRREVESLLRSDDPDAALTNQLQAGVANVSAVSVGSRLGSYEILSALGAGGMGEVYRARDTRLDRDVAIKILPQALFPDAERVARFQREAKVLASLNHPHIGAIYGLHDEGDGVRALVMELVDGEDLDQRVKRGSVPLDEALPIANQIAQALEAAHERGIVHRDLKPANIKLRRDGTVKVLDFGLAKAVASDGETPDLADSPTVTAVATRAGMILGTASYMSPEQAKGRPVDKRTDLWAFGAVLYELLTGTRAFRGESVAEVLSHVLTQAPDWTLLPAGTPAPIRTLLRRCLEKNPARRLDSAAALRLEIDDALAAPSDAMAAAAPQARHRRVRWEAALAAVGAASLIAAAGTWALMRNKPPAPAPAIRFTIALPPTEPVTSTGGRGIALSPDGRYLVYQGPSGLWLRAFDQFDAVRVSDAAGRAPFFSPDSRWIGFFDGFDQLKKVSVTGEPVVPLCRELLGPIQGTWGDDGTIVVSTMEGLRRVSAEGGEPTVLTKTDAAAHSSPWMLPDGRGVLFTITDRATGDRQLAVIDLKSGQQKNLLGGTAGPQYLDTGHIVYYKVDAQAPGTLRSGTLWVVGFDLDRLALRGDPVRVSETLQVDVPNSASYAVSRTGALAYVPAHAPALLSFVWVDRMGRESAIDALPPRPYGTMALSPDGTRLAYSSADRERDIYVWDFAKRLETRLTYGPSFDYLPRWTPDGLRIVFLTLREGRQNLYSVASEAGAIERLTTSDQPQYPNSIAQDAILFAQLRQTGFDILRLPLAAGHGAGKAPLSDADATTLVSTSGSEFEANISPNGKYFAHRSNEFGGRNEVYVRPYPDGSNSQPWQISTEGGVAPVWSRAGTELFYLDGSNTLMAVPVDTSGPQFIIRGRPAQVFGTKYYGSFYSYDVTKDGRFLMMKETTAADQNRIVVVLNWVEELKRLVATK